MLIIKRVEELVRQKTGLGALGEFLDGVGPDVQAMEDMQAKIKAMFPHTYDRDPIERIALFAVVTDCRRLHGDDYRRLYDRAVEALRLADAHYEIISRRVVTGHNRQFARNHRALFRRLEDTRETLADFVACHPMRWMHHVLPTLLFNRNYWLGCTMICASPPRDGLGCQAIHVRL
jgi:hypothetical protein